MRGKFWTKTVVAVLLSSSVLSISSVASANTAVDQSVNRVKAELNRGTTHYVNPAIGGQLVPSSILYPALNSAKKNYQLTRNLINSSTLSSSQKRTKLEEIDSVYNERISKGLIPYIDAYNYATKYLNPIMNNIIAAQDRNDFVTVEKEYHKLSYQLKGRSSILYRFSGKAARDLLLDKYKRTADAKRNELMVPVTIYMKMVNINDLLADNKVVEAKAAYAEIDALLSRLPNPSSNKFVAALLDEVAKVRAAVNALPPGTQQEILNSKVASLVTYINNTQSPYFSVSTSNANSLNVIIKENESIVDFLNKGFYAAFTDQLGVTKVNGFAPTSPQAVSYLASLFPGVTTLHDMKGKSITIPLTVNNGEELNTNFTIHFQ